MEEKVRPELGLPPDEPVTAEHWNRYLDLHPENREEIERLLPGAEAGQIIADLHAQTIELGQPGLG